MAPELRLLIIIPYCLLERPSFPYPSLFLTILISGLSKLLTPSPVLMACVYPGPLSYYRRDVFIFSMRFCLFQPLTLGPAQSKQAPITRYSSGLMNHLESF